MLHSVPQLARMQPLGGKGPNPSLGGVQALSPVQASGSPEVPCHVCLGLFLRN